MSSGGSFWRVPSLGKSLERWSSNWQPPASLPRCSPDHSPQLRNCATLRSRRREALLSSWCSPSSRSRRPSSPGLPPASPRTSCSSARNRCSIAAAGAPQPGLEPSCLHAPAVRPSGGPSVVPRLALRGFPPPSRPPRCHLPPSPPAFPHLAARPALQARPRRTGRCAPANGSRD